MRKLLILFVVLQSFIGSYGQMRDLATMAVGKIVYNSILYDDDNKLFGYLYIYEKNVTGRSKTMEYVMLDKNLNKVSNAEFENVTFKSVSNEYYDCTLMGDYIILNKYYYYVNGFNGSTRILLTSFQIINLKNNAVSNDYTYENGSFKNLDADFETMKADYKGQPVKYAVSCFNNDNLKGFFITEDQKKDYYLEKDLRFFDENKELLWTYNYNENATKRDFNTFRFLASKKNTLYLTISHWKTDILGGFKIQNYYIAALNLKTGEEIFKYQIEQRSDPYGHSITAREFEDKIYITGRYYLNNALSTADNYYLGFYRLILDKNGNELEKIYLPWGQLSELIDINANGRVEKNFKLNPTRYFIFKDGSISILTEKYKIGYASVSVTDFVLFNFDDKFSPKTANIIEKNKSYFSSDFLFYQYIKDDTGVVFFYTDMLKNVDENGAKSILGINTIINGELKEEKIPLHVKKKFFIQPYPAKEGYIMLREYNEKNEYNQIRLEKLNY